jgi:class 3 adenylate cyclase
LSSRRLFSTSASLLIVNTTKTQIVSVFFVDIIGYSKQSVTDQVAIKRAFNAHLGAALAPIHHDGRIVLDTGDGAAVAFLQAPEDALLTSDRLMAMAYDEGEPGLYGIRSGIHFGPAVIVNDVNGFGNLVGDAINDAQRVMSFAGDHEVFASRHYAEMVARISSSFADRFVAAGTSKDKHGRAHDVSRVLPVGYQTPAKVNVGKSVSILTTTELVRLTSPQVAPVATGTLTSLIQMMVATIGVFLITVAAWFFGFRTVATAPPVAPASAAAAPVDSFAQPTPSAEGPSIKKNLDKTAPSAEKPRPVELPRAPVALVPVAKSKVNFPETASPCPQCSCPDLLTKASLGISLSVAESRHLQTLCR